MDRVRFITHRERKILFVDMSNCTAHEVIKIADEVRRIVTAQGRESVFILSDLTGAQFSRAAVARIKEVAVFDRPRVQNARGSNGLVGRRRTLRWSYAGFTTESRPPFG
jgi:hypothetical protein